MKAFRFHRAARAELRAAAEYYAAINPQLAGGFYETVNQLVRDVRAQPALYRLFDPPARRHFRAPFPYALIYVDRPGEVWILAVMHFKRPPGYWRERLDQ